MSLPGTYVRCMSGHYYAATRGDEECPVCEEIARLKAELAHVQQEYLDLAEASTGQVDLVNKLRAELAGSENNRRALAEALDGMQKTLTETQKALDDEIMVRDKILDSVERLDDGTLASKGPVEMAERIVRQIEKQREDVWAERDTANELLKDAMQVIIDVSSSGGWKKAQAMNVRIAAHLKPKEDHL